MSLVGLYIEGTGFLFVAALVGAWALGRRLRPPAARVLGSVVLAAAVANAVMAGRRCPPRSRTGCSTASTGARPDCSAIPCTRRRSSSVPSRWRSSGAGTRRRNALEPDRLSRRVPLFASGVQLSGGRTGLLLLGLVVVCGLFRSGRRTTLVVAAIAVVGVVVGSAAFPSETARGVALAGSDRGIVSGRLDRWRIAVPAIADRPVLGIGPGLYRRATSPHDTVAAAQAFGADRLYQDAHNVVVQYAVTTGILGLALLATWLALAAVGARGELVWFAVFAGLSLFVEPQFIGLTPVLALTLGAAARATPPATTVIRGLVAAGLVVGVVAGGLLLRGDVVFDRAAQDRTLAAAHRAERLLPMWPEPATFTAARVGPAHVRRVRCGCDRCDGRRSAHGAAGGATRSFRASGPPARRRARARSGPPPRCASVRTAPRCGGTRSPRSPWTGWPASPPSSTTATRWHGGAVVTAPWSGECRARPRRG